MIDGTFVISHTFESWRLTKTKMNDIFVLTCYYLIIILAYYYLIGTGIDASSGF